MPFNGEIPGVLRLAPLLNLNTSIAYFGFIQGVIDYICHSKVEEEMVNKIRDMYSWNSLAFLLHVHGNVEELLSVFQGGRTHMHHTHTEHAHVPYESTVAWEDIGARCPGGGSAILIDFSTDRLNQEWNETLQCFFRVNLAKGVTDKSHRVSSLVDHMIGHEARDAMAFI